MRPNIVMMPFAEPGLLREQISAVHAFDGRALVTYVESANQRSAALEAGADWRQGHAIGLAQATAVSALEAA